EGSDVDVARGDHASEWSGDLAEPLHAREALHVGALRVRRGGARLVRRGLLVQLLLAHGAIARARLPSVQVALCESERGVRLRQLRPRLLHFLIDFGRFNGREQLSVAHSRAYIGVPAPYVS